MDKMIILFTIAVFVLLGLAWIIGWYKSYLSDVDYSTRMTLKQVKKWYYVNPDRWELSRFSIVYRYSENYGEIIVVNLSLIDFYRYLHWRKRLEKNAEEKMRDRNLQIIMNSVYDDILSLQSISEKQIDDGIKMLSSSMKDEIVLNIGEENGKEV